MNSRKMEVILACVVGSIIGLGAFTFYHAKGYSYLSDNPSACMNCHVMREPYNSWQHSSHRNWAGCNDCHMPTAGIDRYYTKMVNGWNHSVKFTFGNFPEPIKINNRNKKIALTNCIKCHEKLISEMHINVTIDNNIDCIRCHGNVGHQSTK